MKSELEAYFKELEQDIQIAYEETKTIEESEKLAAKFLGAQLKISFELAVADLDARMRKSGTKAIKSAVYNEVCSKSDKKPSDVFIEQQINISELVLGEQQALDEAEVYRDQLERMLSVSKEAHLYFRSLMKSQ